MRNIQLYIALLFCVAATSCGHKLTAIYYCDNTKVDDGEIFGESLGSFFDIDSNIHVYSVRSNRLDKELCKIRDSIKIVTSSLELDDGYYGYAFITSSRDTLFADYGLRHWKYRGKQLQYKGDFLNPFIGKAP